MNAWIKKLAVAGAIAATGLVVGCNDRTEREPDVEIEAREGVGGSGEVGDDKVGRNEGVINDGEGPIEENRNPNTRSGQNEGVLDDGEGPIENNPETNR